jgi:hypothetical protein
VGKENTDGRREGRIQSEKRIEKESSDRRDMK